MPKATKRIVLSWEETIRRHVEIDVPKDFPTDPYTLDSHPKYGSNGPDPWLEYAEGMDPDEQTYVEARRVYAIVPKGEKP